MAGQPIFEAGVHPGFDALQQVVNGEKNFYEIDLNLWDEDSRETILSISQSVLQSFAESDDSSRGLPEGANHLIESALTLLEFIQAQLNNDPTEPLDEHVLSTVINLLETAQDGDLHEVVMNHVKRAYN